MKAALKFLFTVLLAGGVFSLPFSCKKKDKDEPGAKPEACFTMSPRFVPTASMTSQFSNCSKNHDRVEWNFGDGGSSVLNEPSHFWPTKGTFEAALTVFNSAGSAKTSQKMYVGQRGHVYLTVALKDWKTEPGEMGFTWDVFAIRANDNSSTNVYYNSHPAQFADSQTGGSCDLVVSEDTPLHLFIMFNGGSKSDTLRIKGIHIIDGVAAPTGSASLKTCDVSYTVSTGITP